MRRSYLHNTILSLIDWLKVMCKASIILSVHIRCPKCTFFDLSHTIQSHFARHHGTKLFANCLVCVLGIGRVLGFLSSQLTVHFSGMWWCSLWFRSLIAWYCFSQRLDHFCDRQGRPHICSRVTRVQMRCAEHISGPIQGILTLFLCHRRMPRLAGTLKGGTDGGFVNVHQLLGVHTTPFEVTEHEHLLVGLAEHCMYVELGLTRHPHWQWSP